LAASNAIIFRATRQWFIAMDSTALVAGRCEVAEKAVAQTEFFPVGTRTPRCHGAQSARLVRFPSAQLGHADGSVRAQGHRELHPRTLD
jgi:hypothetical protein